MNQLLEHFPWGKPIGERIWPVFFAGTLSQNPRNGSRRQLDV
jgi:hypothetical protein